MENASFSADDNRICLPAHPRVTEAEFDQVESATIDNIESFFGEEGVKANACFTTWVNGQGNIDLTKAATQNKILRIMLGIGSRASITSQPTFEEFEANYGMCPELIQWAAEWSNDSLNNKERLALKQELFRFGLSKGGGGMYFFSFCRGNWQEEHCTTLPCLWRVQRLE